MYKNINIELVFSLLSLFESHLKNSLRGMKFNVCPLKERIPVKSALFYSYYSLLYVSKFF